MASIVLNVIQVRGIFPNAIILSFWLSMTLLRGIVLNATTHSVNLQNVILLSEVVPNANTLSFCKFHFTLCHSAAGHYTLRHSKNFNLHCVILLYTILLCVIFLYVSVILLNAFVLLVIFVNVRVIQLNVTQTNIVSWTSFFVASFCRMPFCQMPFSQMF